MRNIIYALLMSLFAVSAVSILCMAICTFVLWSNQFYMVGDWHLVDRFLALCLLVVSFAYSFMWLEVRK